MQIYQEVIQHTFLKKKFTLKPVLKVYYWSSLIPASCWGLKLSTTKLILEARDPRHQKKLFNTKTKPENPEYTNISSSCDFNLSQVCVKLWLTSLGFIHPDKEKNPFFHDKWHKKEKSIKVSIRHTASSMSASLCCHIYWKIKAFFYGCQKFQKKRRKHLQSAHFERGIITL